MSSKIGKLQKNPSLSALNLNEEKIASLEQTFKSKGLSQETIEIRSSASIVDDTDPEELLHKLNDFSVILKEPIICSGFRKFLAKNFSSENLLFWKEIENYKTLSEPSELRKKAVEIFRDFVSGTSENEVNLPHSEKLSLQKSLSDPNFLPTPSFFDNAQLEIFNLMRRDSFLNFLKDPIFEDTKKILERVRCLSIETSNMDNENELTERDWTLILTEAEDVHFDAGDCIVEQDQKNTFLYQLKSGKLQVEKTVSGTKIPIAMIEKEGTIFGEMSVLGKLGVATASIYAATDAVVSRLEVPFIFALFLSDPVLARRFYINMGKKLAKLLQDISSLTPNSHENESPSSSNGSSQVSDNTSPKNDLKLSRESSGSKLPRPLVRMTTTNRIAKEQIAVRKQENSDRTYHERFGLSPNELVVKEIQCDLEKMVSRRGTLYISQHYICFYSRIFGQKTKEVIHIRSVLNVCEKQNSKHPTLTITTPRNKYRFNFRTSEELLSIQHIILDFKTANEAKGESPLSSSQDGSSKLSLSRSVDLSKDRSQKEKLDNLTLTTEDWEILLGNKQSMLTFTKGDAILVEGKHYSMICQIVSGNCRIEKQVPNQPDLSVVLGKMSSGEIFGEITFLTEGAATASVIANDDFVDMYFIDGQYLKETLWETHPQVVVRFYNYICINLAKRIAQREKEGWRKG